MALYKPGTINLVPNEAFLVLEKSPFMGIRLTRGPPDFKMCGYSVGWNALRF